ncbi:MAG: terpene cyclase/mutase family protein [Fuerstiella sp.]|nr:terpene cyclase/mutase family protein [Fuerstiella sp.]MCP4857578.1 terpene cyclase/mutase family protein [Fuerstiella sp.]
MSRVSDVNTGQESDSREEFAQHLRHRARQAAEASVHHAWLAQQYLDLSQKFDQLAEQSGSTDIAQLQQAVASLDDSISNQPELSSKLNTGCSDAAGPVSIAAAASERRSASCPTLPLPADPAPREGNSQQESATGAKSPKRRPRHVTTRRFVERVRSAKPAASKRVRVKAKKSDLKPKQRTAGEAFTKGGSSIATSLGLFALSVFILHTITWQLEDVVPLNPLIAAFASDAKPVEEAQPVEPPEEEEGDQTEQEVEEPVEIPEEEPVVPEPEEEPAEEPEPAELESVSDVEMSESPVPLADVDPTTAVATASINNRSDAGRKVMLQKHGGSQASESAVRQALEWLASVQHPQGWWDFGNVGPSGNAGTINNPIGGTAYALLPFLAAGQTHREGDYQKAVAAGLTYLTNIGVAARAGYDLRGMVNKQSNDKAPNEAYYAHGAATLALCEAYGMTKDRRLKKAAEGAVRFIVNSQDPRGGGWRYNPQEPGSTSVTVVQVMALMAGKKAGIDVPDSVFKGVMHYLDSVQVDGTGRYGYEIQKKQYTGARTAMALLCRMYLGWGRDDGDMRAGVTLLDKAGPYENLYSLYFATQAMKNWGGDEWVRWNVRLRDDLIARQETAGPAKGSWKPRTGALHAKQGGRLLTTSLATMTLEVYYRYKPLLPEEAVSDMAKSQ